MNRPPQAPPTHHDRFKLWPLVLPLKLCQGWATASLHSDGQLHLESYPQRQRPHDHWLSTCYTFTHTQAFASWVPSTSLVGMVVAHSRFFSQWLDIREHLQRTIAVALNLYFAVQGQFSPDSVLGKYQC